MSRRLKAMGVEKYADGFAIRQHEAALSIPFQWKKPTSLYRIIQQAAEDFKADIALVDVGPNFGAINRAALICADHVVIPVAPDLFSIQGLRNLGPTLASWRKEWKIRLDLKIIERFAKR